MLSSASTINSRQGPGYNKGYGPHVPKGFTVRVFKGPSIYSFSQTSTNFDRGYQSIPLTESHQSISGQTWHTPSNTTLSSTPGMAPREPKKLSQLQASSSSSNSNGSSKYDTKPQPAPPSYSIYQGSKTYIYEASLSSKGDLYSSSSDDDANTLEYTPSAFSPAMSTDSTTTLRGAITPDISSTDLHGSAPTLEPSSSSHIPRPGQAQTQALIKGVLGNQAPNNYQSPADGILAAYIPHSDPSNPSRRSLTVSSGNGRSNTPLPVVSGSVERGPGRMSHDRFSPTDDNVRSSYLQTRSSLEDDGFAGVSGANELGSGSRTSTFSRHPSSRHDSLHSSYLTPAAVGECLSGKAERFYPELPLHSSPEHYHTQAAKAHSRLGSRQQLPISLESVSQERNRPTSIYLPTESVESAMQVPQPPLQSASTGNNRYVPVSRTMMSNDSSRLARTVPPEADNRNREGHGDSDAEVALSSGRERERRPSMTGTRISLTLPPSRVSAFERGGAGSDRLSHLRDEAQIPPAELNRSVPPSEHSQAEQKRVLSQPQLSHPHSASTQAQNRELPATSRYVTSNATRRTNNASLQDTTLRSSTEDMRVISSAQQSVSQARDYMPSDSYRGLKTSADHSVHSTNTSRGTNMAPSRVRRDSIINPNVDGRTPRRQSSIFQPSLVNQRDSMSFVDSVHNHSEVVARTGQVHQARYDSDRGPFGDIQPYDHLAPPSTVSSDPGPEPHRRDSFVEQTTVPRYASSGPERSQTPFPAPLREPQRRYSDGDSSVAGDSIYAPAYAGVVEPLRAVQAEVQPQRRYSDGDHTDPSNAQDRATLALFRTVRWNENLICPSPILAHQRRKGWYNRRGDQLWTNDGAYKPPPAGHDYPPDLDTYPDHGDGWMNEHGVRIDMGHRLVPKAPLKSALKPNRTQHMAAPSL